MGDFADSFEVLTGQVEGFGQDLRACVATWEETDGAAAEVFARYGEGL